MENKKEFEMENKFDVKVKHNLYMDKRYPRCALCEQEIKPPVGKPGNHRYCDMCLTRFELPNPKDPTTTCTLYFVSLRGLNQILKKIRKLGKRKLGPAQPAEDHGEQTPEA